MKLMTRLRLERGLSMSALARRAKMHVTSISQIENGHLMPYPHQINQIVCALEWGGKPAELFQECEVPHDC